MKLSDEALVLACRRGDETAWETLVERFQRLVYTISRRAGLDEDAAADVFQNVFASLVERLDRIEQPDRIQAWLVTTAKRETWRAIS
ncbi:MAG TPA: sigma factor, partial [Blastocatellia bacterium]|nr:sigma factor [Blastocatellia bacterium]